MAHALEDLANGIEYSINPMAQVKLIRDKVLSIAQYLTTGGTATGNTPEINTRAGKITTASLTTAAAATTDIVLTNSKIATTSICNVTISGYTGAGIPIIAKAVPTASTLTITIMNIHGADALNAAVKIDFAIEN